MRLVTKRIMHFRIESSGAWCTRIHIPVGRARIKRIHTRNRRISHHLTTCACGRSNFTRIQFALITAQHLVSRIMTYIISAEGILKYVENVSNQKIKSDHSPVNSWIDNKSINEQSENCQNKSMTPNKPQHFDKAIERVLNFMNGRYLHDLMPYLVYSIIVALVLLKNHQFTENWGRFLMYSGSKAQYPEKKVQRAQQ